MKVNRVPKKNLAILSAAFCAVMFAFSYNASATPHPLPAVITASTAIQGNITFTGGATLDTGDANTAHAVTSFVNTIVQSVTGDFDTFINPLDPATFSASWVFDPSTPTPGLWTVGGFTFDSGGVFSFSASGLAVPDGGSAVALLGLALIGIEVLRRKLMAV
jgi:hypothetical protein